MKIGSDAKAIIESMNWHELTAYEDHLGVEIERHQEQCRKLIKNLSWSRKWLRDCMCDYYRASFKFSQTTIYDHRQKIKSLREQLLQTHDRMDMLELLQ